MASIERITEAVQGVLRRWLVIDVSPIEADLVSLTIQQSGATGTSISFVVAWIGEGWPKEVDKALQRSDRPDVLVARHLSPGAKERAKELAISWVDETGAAEIFIDGLDISRPGTPSHQQTVPQWTTGTVAVAEALLCGVPGTIEATREATGLSTGSCVRALKTLSDLELLTSQAERGPNSQRQIAAIDDFLVAYREAAFARRSKLPTLHAHMVWRDPLQHIIQVTRRWNEAGITWAATGALGALVVAPYLTSVNSVELYVERNTLNELDAAVAMIDATPSSEKGARLVLRPFPTTTSRRFIEEQQGLPVVPTPRLYADLFNVGVRGGEAAQHLREVTNLGGTS